MAMEKVTTSVHKYFILLLLQNWTENRAKDYSVLQNSSFDGSNAIEKKIIIIYREKYKIPCIALIMCF